MRYTVEFYAHREGSVAIRDDIVGVLTRAEDQLTSRLQKALKDREYSDVAELASVSQQVQELIQSMGGTRGRPREALSEPRL